MAVFNFFGILCVKTYYRTENVVYKAQHQYHKYIYIPRIYLHIPMIRYVGIIHCLTKNKFNN